MAKEYSYDPTGPVKTRDLRVCKFYAKLLKNKFNDLPDISCQDIEICRHELNNAIHQCAPNEIAIRSLMSALESMREENILPDESFNWLKKNERATFWLWATLHNMDDIELKYMCGYINESLHDGIPTIWYQRLNLSLSPTNHQDRINLIIAFMDELIFPAPPVMHRKKTLMENLKQKWKTVFARPLPFKWLPVNDEDAVLWAWESLKKHQSGTFGSFGNTGPLLTQWFSPVSHSERALALQAALDVWDAPDSRRLFLLNLNKAWNQQKLRKSRTDKKAINTYLKNETKTRLDLMAEHNRLRIGDMLEKLINEYYQEHFCRQHNHTETETRLTTNSEAHSK